MRAAVHLHRPRVVLVTVLAAILIMLTTAVAGAVLSSDAGPFTACLGVKTNKGLVYNTAAASEPIAPCNRGDLQIQFSNAQGPQGAAGPVGPAGPEGPKGDPGDLTAVLGAIAALDARMDTLEERIAVLEDPSSDDADDDGYAAADDCDDGDATVHPGAVEDPTNAVDDDCDGVVDEPLETPNDADSDGIENALDNCPTISNSDQRDADADGTGDACDSTPNGEFGDSDSDTFSVDAGDCDDGNPTVYPGASELIDGLDNDCDGQLGSWPAGATDIGACELGTQSEMPDGTLGPIVGAIGPAPEVPDNGIDDDCDGLTDEQE